MQQRTARFAYIVAIAAMPLLGCGDSGGPDEDEPGTAGFEFVTITRDGKPWQAETSGFHMIGPGHASFGWDRYIPGTHYREGIAIMLRSFAGAGDYLLSEGSTENQASYGLINLSNNTATGVGTTSAYPGRLRISGFDPADSTIAGNFRFDLHLSDGTRTSFAGVFRIRHPCC